MTNLLIRQIEQWIEDNSHLVSVNNPISTHINELLGRQIELSETLEVSALAFVTLLKQLYKLQLPARPSLIVPLIGISKKIERAAPPNIKVIEEQLDIEPPSLYLLTWEPVEYYVTCEEYRSPLTFDVITPPLPGVYTYYREVRYDVAIKNDWEFARGVYVSYHPSRVELSRA